MSFNRFCLVCYEHFCNEDEYNKHIAICGKSPTVEKPVRTRRPKNATNTALLGLSEQVAEKNESELPEDEVLPGNDDKTSLPSESTADSAQGEQVLEKETQASEHIRKSGK